MSSVSGGKLLFLLWLMCVVSRDCLLRCNVRVLCWASGRMLCGHANRCLLLGWSMSILNVGK